MRVKDSSALTRAKGLPEPRAPRWQPRSRWGRGSLPLLPTPLPRRPQSAPHSPLLLSPLMLRAAGQRSSSKGWRDSSFRSHLKPL